MGPALKNWIDMVSRSWDITRNIFIDGGRMASEECVRRRMVASRQLALYIDTSREYKYHSPAAM